MKKLNSTGELYEEYLRKMNTVADLRNASAVLQWDQETYLPPKGAHFRGSQLATLSELAHEFFTGDAFYELVKELSQREELQENQRKNIELTLYDIEKQRKLSSAFVRKMTEAVNTAWHQWINARKENSFRVFEPSLDHLVQLKLDEADMLGYEHHPYNALLNDYDKGSTVEELDGIFAGIIPFLRDIIFKIGEKPAADDSCLKRHYPRNIQWDLGMRILKEMGFDFEAGRQDISEHPFTTSFNPRDVRLTTRIDEYDFGNMLWSCIHELGHGLYEQGLPEDQYGLPLGEAASLSIHESQSRLWENQIGRSEAFIRHYFPVIREYFPETLSDVSEEQFYKAINKVYPSLIRTEADELTYHMHIFIRYELEKKLLSKKLKTSEIPEYWNKLYKELLNVIVPDDKSGCLQDVHWSHGSFGYFPTYSTGSFYAAQFFHFLGQSLPGMNEDISNGHFNRILSWLRDNIHSKGRKYESGELCWLVTGENLNPRYFKNYVLNKFGSLYSLER